MILFDKTHDAPERRDDIISSVHNTTNALKDITDETSDNEHATNNNDTILDPGDAPSLQAGL